MRNFILISILFCLFLNAEAYTLSGIVRDSKYEPLAFANVYLQGTTKGTTTNEDGVYQLDLGDGSYQVVFDYIGYTRKIEEVIINGASKELNIMLYPEDIQLREVIVNGSEDPAYAIMRKAIAKRKYHYEQVDNYKCTVYTKGLQRLISAPDRVFGMPINFDGSLDSNNAGIIYLSETISELTFKKPDLIKEVMLSSKVSGNSQTFSWNRAGESYRFNFYQNNIDLEFLGDRIFISPLSENAMMYYRYKLEGFFEEDGKLINRIKVTPRRDNDPVFNGHIYIVENSWNIHSLDLLLTQQNQIKFLDTLWIKQVYVPLEDSLWMLLSQRFEFNFNILQIKARGYFNMVFRDCEVNAALSKKTFSNEILKVEEGANEKDSLYWINKRPVPLTEEEISDYARKDSMEELRQTKEYLRTLDKKANKFTPWSILLGYRFQNSYRKVAVTFSPFLESFNYNTVEGFNLKFGAEITKELKKNRFITIRPTVRYGFSNRHFNMMAETRFDYNSKRDGYIAMDIGRYVYQFNRSEPISEIVNSLYSLFGGKNYMKIFEEAFIRLRHRIELVNGLKLWTKAEYARRYPLINTSAVSARKEEKIDFTKNMTFSQHDAFIISATLSYTPGQKYISRPDQKIVTDSKYPTFALTYKKAIPGVFKSRTNFDYLALNISDDLAMGLFGNSFFSVSLGTFLNDARLDTMDFRHFDGNQTIFGSHYRTGFQILEYYAASTTDKFIEAHYQHSFDGFLFNKIPGVRKLKLQAVVGVHFLYSQNYRDHTEITAGIENILRVLRVDFVAGLSKNHPNSFGFRIGIDLNQF